jgi:4-amino-4-deoxy-L-arabinose transferase-like glycosyltransferase
MMRADSGAGPTSPLPSAAVVARSAAHGAERGPLPRGEILALVVLAALVWGAHVWRPVDGTAWDRWREPDVAGMARNFYREGMDIRYPRIDWRGDGPGYVESEFPLYPWSVAALYRVFGYHEPLARLLSYLLLLSSFVVFLRLARDLLPFRGAVAAGLVFALNPVVAGTASAVRAEPLMFLGYIAGIHFFQRWLASGRRLHYTLALAATLLAILGKLPAALAGLVMAGLALERFGWRALRRADVWLFAAASVAAPLLWYAHAHDLWQRFGNSLGISDEAYVALTPRRFLAALVSLGPGALGLEIHRVWMPAGVVLGAAGLLAAVRDRSPRLPLWWLGAVAIFYLVTIRTTGATWAAYYHVLSAPVAALFAGLAVAHLGLGTVERAPWRRTTFALLAAGVALALGGTLAFPRHVSLAKPLLAAGLVALAGGAWMRMRGTVRTGVPAGAPRRTRGRDLATCGLLAVIALSFVATLLQEVNGLRRQLRLPSDPLYPCAQAFQTAVPPGTLVVASGDPRRNELGLSRGFSAPYMFFWMDRKGFSLAEEDQSLPKLTELARRGARFFVAERRKLAARPGFEEELRGRCPVVRECDRALLFELTPLLDAPAPPDGAEGLPTR